MSVRILGLDVKCFFKEPVADSDRGDNHSLPLHAGKKTSNCSHGEILIVLQVWSQPRLESEFLLHLTMPGQVI